MSTMAALTAHRTSSGNSASRTPRQICGAQQELRQGVGDARRPADVSRASGGPHGCRPATPPELIPRMLELHARGYDQVVPRRDRAGDGVVRTLLSRGYYALVRHLMDVKVLDGAGDFRLLSRHAVDTVLSLPETNRFSKGIFPGSGSPRPLLPTGTHNDWPAVRSGGVDACSTTVLTGCCLSTTGH